MDALTFRPRWPLAAVSLLGLLTSVGCRHLSGQHQHPCGCGCQCGQVVYCQPDPCAAVAPSYPYTLPPQPPGSAPTPGNASNPPEQSTEMPPLPLAPGN